MIGVEKPIQQQRLRQDPRFWGGDGAITLQLSPGRIGLFCADTFFTSPPERNRNIYPTGPAEFVRNSFGVTSTQGGNFSWPHVQNSGDFLPKPANADFFWPSVGFIRNNTIYFPGGSFNKGQGSEAALVGTSCLSLGPANGDPNAWKNNPSSIDWPGTHMDGVLVHGGMLYAYGDVLVPTAFLTLIVPTLARTPLSSFDDGAPNWMFWNGSTWTSFASDCAQLIPGVSTNGPMSVHFEPSIKKFVMVYVSDSFSGIISARSAVNPWGPWSAAVEVLRPSVMDVPGNGVRLYHVHKHPALGANIFGVSENGSDLANPLSYFPTFFGIPSYSSLA